MCLEIYGLAPAHILYAPGQAWQKALKNTKVKLDLITDINMLLMIEKAIRGGINHAIYCKLNNLTSVTLGTHTSFILWITYFLHFNRYLLCTLDNLFSSS